MDHPDWDKVTVVNGWLVVDTGEHTCAGGTPEASYMHEASCGWEPIATMDAVWAALIKTGEVEVSSGDVEEGTAQRNSGSADDNQGSGQGVVPPGSAVADPARGDHDLDQERAVALRTLIYFTGWLADEIERECGPYGYERRTNNSAVRVTLIEVRNKIAELVKRSQ